MRQNRSFLIAFDGTDFFASENISCPCCTQTTLKNGKTLNRHIALTPVLVAPGQNAVVALPPEFVQPQDGHDKQDCELAACARWLSQRGSHYAAWGITYLGDDLYCHQPHCERVLQQQAQFLFTCKPESHATLYEWVADLSRIGGVTTLVQSRRTGKKVFTDTWRYVNQVPLRNSDDALMVNWFELVTTDAEGKVLFRNAWATSHEISYHFEHNFGHGKQHLSNLFATLILLAFLVHTTLECIDTAFQSVRKALPSRQTFFEHLRALIQYLPFDNWTHLMQFMLQHLTPESIDSG